MYNVVRVPNTAFEVPLTSQEILKYVATYFVAGWERRHQKRSLAG